MPWMAVYQDYPEGPRYQGSVHNALGTAEAQARRMDRDRYWGRYSWSVVQVARRPRAHETVEDVMLQPPPAGAGEEE
jgi:hypothetical protein